MFTLPKRGSHAILCRPIGEAPDSVRGKKSSERKTWLGALILFSIEKSREISVGLANLNKVSRLWDTGMFYNLWNRP